ncbi:aminoglycoside adenylyltransferase [Psychrobacillus glaciei]|uniref:Aminoglycoside adenylyltransferase n=1 Tax=Psychrobacillus glaciei TaxID=2283160 RepID=A0A5J6SNF8_9BACI|nr:aminoglycoside 6-adenylyltransferase [Psychrobacillus glaciei]QFF99319.1 aminoglycoside adenylyltransferase [Psychrobacillus glaciei]
MSDYKEIMNKVILWGQQEDDIRSIFIVGSMARSDKPADKWSDMDLVIVTSDVEKWLQSEEWIRKFGNPQISFLERTHVGNIMERRVMYDGSCIVDFNFMKLEVAKTILESEEVQGVIARGVKVLLDKDSVTEVFHNTSSLIKNKEVPEFSEFKNDVNDFWFHAVYTAQKLRRGELLVAKSNCDEYLKRLLIKFVKLQTIMKNSTNQQSWHDVRFFEEWADKEVVQEFQGIYGKYNEESVWDALFETMKLYRKVAKQIAVELEYEYPIIADQSADKLVTNYYKGRTYLKFEE